jgi:glycosyltransferase involved in cell wall biosynthesis
MSNQPLVSIIIPTYNRAHLIGETLDSVLAQTYENWECIIVDDGSRDNTDEVVGEYTQTDSRFKYYHRPEEHLPGGNGARNYGFKMSQGEYVNWFDSDDLMVAEKLELNMQIVYNRDANFVIDKFVNFEHKANVNKEKIKVEEIKLRDYIIHKVFWGTCNITVKKNFVEKIFFNETLKTGQEYNFFVKIICFNNWDKGFFINNNLVLRRIHKESIQQKQKQNSLQRHINKFYIYWETYKETKNILNKNEKKFFEKSFLGHYFTLLANGHVLLKPIEIVRETRKNRLQTNLLLSILYLFMITKKGYFKLRTLYLNFIN